MSDVPAKSCRVYIRFGSASADCQPTVEDIRGIFSVHGNIVGMYCVKAYVFYNIIIISMTPIM